MKKISVLIIVSFLILAVILTGCKEKVQDETLPTEQIECRLHSDCGDLGICEDSMCLDVECKESVHCENGYYCEEYICKELVEQSPNLDTINDWKNRVSELDNSIMQMKTSSGEVGNLYGHLDNSGITGNDYDDYRDEIDVLIEELEDLETEYQSYIDELIALLDGVESNDNLTDFIDLYNSYVEDLDDALTDIRNNADDIRDDINSEAVNVECINDAGCAGVCISSVCVDCRQNSDCNVDEYCDSNNCVLLVTTETICNDGIDNDADGDIDCDDTDCSGDVTCPCTGDADCFEGVCENNACVECRDPGDCGGIGACYYNQCVQCITDIECDIQFGPGYMCNMGVTYNNVCVMYGCTDDSDCLNNFVCFDDVDYGITYCMSD
ncbi:MAG: hypothetical protein ABIG93_04920 [archaeon]|nr:hypothetical protein [Nanoarchaeota archaeon]